MAADLLPMFPLKVVLFPDTALPLHIFEERYKQMIGEVMAAKSEFGVLCADANTVASVGCTARVAKRIRRYDDGRMDILTIGRRRFRIRRLQREKAYLQGTVDFLFDEPAGERPELKSRCLKLFRDLYQSTPGHLPAADLERVSTEVVSNYVAYYSDLPLAKKQSLLELTSAEQRLLAAEAAMKERLLAQSDERERSRAVRANGHFPPA